MKFICSHHNSVLNNYLKDIIKISWPIIVGQLGFQLTGLFDTMMVGDLGHEQLAAAGVCNSIFFLVAIFPLGFIMAYSTIVGILQGKNKTSSYRILARDSFIVTIGLAILGGLGLWFFVSHFHFFKQTDIVSALSVPYLELLTWSLAPLLVFFYAKNLCDGFSYTEGGMIITLVALALNVFLNWVLIHRKRPRWRSFEHHHTLKHGEYGLTGTTMVISTTLVKWFTKVMEQQQFQDHLQYQLTRL